MFNVGPGELIVIMALALLFFGPKKLPEIGRSIGSAMREFRKASSEFMEAMNQPVYEQEETPPPVKSIEYPSTPALSDPENYEALPYGSDFYATGSEHSEHGDSTYPEHTVHASAATDESHTHAAAPDVWTVPPLDSTPDATGTPSPEGSQHERTA